MLSANCPACFRRALVGEPRLADLHVLVVALGSVSIIGGDVQDVAGADGDILITGRIAGTDLGTLCVEGNGQRPSCLGALGLARIVDDRLVVLVGAVGEVHAHDIETSLAEGIDLIGGVGLGTDCADDGCAAVLLGRRILSVQLREPFDPGTAGVEVVERVGHGGSGNVGICGETERGSPRAAEKVRYRPIAVVQGSRRPTHQRSVGLLGGVELELSLYFGGRRRSGAARFTGSVRQRAGEKRLIGALHPRAYVRLIHSRARETIHAVLSNLAEDAGSRAVGAVLRSLFLRPFPPHPRVASQRSQAPQISPDWPGQHFFAHGRPAHCFHGRLSWNTFVSRGGATSRRRCWRVSQWADGRAARAERARRSTRHAMARQQDNGSPDPWRARCRAVMCILGWVKASCETDISPWPSDGHLCSFSTSSWRARRQSATWCVGLEMQ